ncbi:L-alanyl-D-glutamate peptidase [Bacillus phage Shbh1]|uniref:Putative cell wall-binding, peptidase-related domain protein n=1 Tax=Bacillus phage Shbh1 TaxID=1796992 RepID=A0A142F1E5_9CAUD|nr:L-alanyl-D-glutamate peptidase [Bacillus phage Shbh1]AMQ66602.1 putative cell wall-binding, peptidase-related domain protein [Bacillus phage Shbh1]
MDLKKGIFSCALCLGILLGGHSVSQANTYTGSSIVDYLVSQGEDFSFSNREKLASHNGIENYRGTANQNLKLLAKLRGESFTPVSNSNTESNKTKNNQSSEVSVSGRTLEVTATAYTAYCQGCSGITYTGIDLRSNPNQKVIAVDPNVIPLGSRVYVEGYGEAVAGDIGGAIKGHKIDVFIPNHSDAIAFGRKTLKVTVLD